jgi:hypothetical protein
MIHAGLRVFEGGVILYFSRAFLTGQKAIRQHSPAAPRKAHTDRQQ